MPIQMGGIASGLDTQTIIQDLMKIEKNKVTKLEKDKQLVEWRKEAYNNVSKDFANFILDTRKELGLNNISSNGSLRDSSINNLNWVKEATSTNEDIATVSSSAKAVNGSFDVTVKRLADNFSTASSSNISIGDKSNIKDQFNLLGIDTINFTIETNEGTKEFDYTDLANTSLEDIVKDINNANIGVTAVYDEGIDRFFLQTDKTGESNTVKITKGTATVPGGGVDFLTGGSDVLNINLADNNEYKGIDALIDFNGATNIQKDSNSFQINGINLELKKADPGETITVNVNTDVDGVYDKIKTFIDKYNEVVSKTNELLNEKKYRDYKPLSKEEKDSMNEDDIKLWEEKAKSGLIKGDMVVSGTLSNVRNGMYQNVEGVTGSFKHITDIGISTASYFGGSNNGQLEIDEAKLKEKIAEDVDGVLELLFKKPDDESLSTGFEKNLNSAQIEQKRSESGIINRLFDNLTVGIKGVVGKAGLGSDSSIYRDVNTSISLEFIQNYQNISLLDSELTRFDKRIDDMNDDLNSLENRYWRKFTAMEKALNEMNSKSSWLSSQLG